MANPVPAGSYRFGPFRLDPASRVLGRDGRVVSLAPRTFDLLHTFARSGGRLLTKHELLVSIWGDVNVEEASLAFQVSTLRKALGEPRTAWIETVPKHGYRFTAPVREVQPQDTRNREVPSTPPAGRVRPRTMPLSSGSWLGPYEVLSPLGAGGMASARGCFGFRELRRVLAVAQKRM